MDIIIGKQGNQPFQLTESSISRQHAVLHVDEVTGKMYLSDNNSTNGTYILCNNKFTRIYKNVPVTLNTVVRVGEKETFYIKDFIKKKEETVDISKLRVVYDTYNNNKMDIEYKQSNMMMMRMAAITLGGIFGVIISMLIPKEYISDSTIVNGLVKVVGTLLAIALSWIMVSIKSKNLIKRKDMNDRYFKRKYSCPKCGYHFGMKLYENILAEGKCPNANCKCKFTGK